MRKPGIDPDQRVRKRDRGIGPFVYDTLSQALVWCGSPAALGGSVAAGMLLAGATASPLHCAPMCGGFVLGQVSDRMARLPSCHLSECQRLRAASLTPYHLGRVTTYTVLGLAAGSGGMVIQRLNGGAGVFLLLAAALLVLRAIASPRSGMARPIWANPGAMPPQPGRTRAAIRSLPSSSDSTRGSRAPRTSLNAVVPWPLRQMLRSSPSMTMKHRPSLRGYPLGLALGFLPCGILYTALAAAAATGSPLYGALAMACFGLGTVPALVVIGLFGAAAGHRFRDNLAALTPAVLLFNAGLLTLLGVRLLAGS
jgi:sulfite exporter TauE/SafE